MKPIVLNFAELNKSKTKKQTKQNQKYSFSVPAAVRPDVKDTVEVLTMWHSGMKRSPRGQGEGSPLCGSNTLPAGYKEVASLIRFNWLNMQLFYKVASDATEGRAEVPLSNYHCCIFAFWRRPAAFWLSQKWGATPASGLLTVPGGDKEGMKGSNVLPGRWGWDECGSRWWGEILAAKNIKINK